MRGVTRLFIAAGLIVLIAAAVVPAFRTACTTIDGVDGLSIDTTAVGRGEARRFCYMDKAGNRIRFVLARGSDGKVRSIFDACRQCAAYRKGFALTKGAVVCRLCGNRYPIDRMMAGEASCVPMALAHDERGNMVQIKTADLKKGQSLF